MKKIIIIILIISFKDIGYAQLPEAGTYYTDNYINKFEGTWQWASGGDTVIIKLKKVKYTFGSLPFYADMLIGCHKYVKAGQIIESSVNKWDSILLYNNHNVGTMLGSNHNFSNDTTKVECSIRDITKFKDAKLILQWVAGNPATLVWTLKVRGGLLSDPRQELGLTLPRSLILTKQ